MQLTTEEIWKDIHELHDWYQISNHGHLRTKDHPIEYMRKDKLTTRIAKSRPLITTNGHTKISINNKQDNLVFTDELVIRYFTNWKYDDWKIIIHLDGNQDNSNIYNLSILDPFENPDEIWKYVESWKPYYMISNKGRVLQCPVEGCRRCKLLHPTNIKTSNSVQFINPENKSIRKTYYVHHLVISNFVDLEGILHGVIHKDGDLSNNNIDNLEYRIKKHYISFEDELEGEVWKPIPGYEGYYEVSSIGRVRRLPRIVKAYSHGKPCEKYEEGALLAISPSPQNGYVQTGLNKAGEHKLFLVHRLVAMAFIPNPENKPEVNHKDRNHSNNRVDNLEWVTKLENTHHAIQNGWNPKLSRLGKKNSKEWYARIKKCKTCCNS